MTVFHIFKVYILLHICCLIFFIFLSFRMIFPPMYCLRLLLLRKAIIGSTEKVLSKALLVFKMDHWLRIIYFILGSVRSYVSVSGNTWVFCVVFSVTKSSLSWSLIFLIRLAILYNCTRIRCLLNWFVVCWTDWTDCFLLK